MNFSIFFIRTFKNFYLYPKIKKEVLVMIKGICPSKDDFLLFNGLGGDLKNSIPFFKEKIPPYSSRGPFFSPGAVILILLLFLLALYDVFC
jgi:hypothetical protein